MNQPMREETLPRALKTQNTTSLSWWLPWARRERSISVTTSLHAGSSSSSLLLLLDQRLCTGSSSVNTSWPIITCQPIRIKDHYTSTNQKSVSLHVNQSEEYNYMSTNQKKVFSPGWGLGAGTSADTSDRTGTGTLRPPCSDSSDISSRGWICWSGPWPGYLSVDHWAAWLRTLSCYWRAGPGQIRD